MIWDVDPAFVRTDGGFEVRYYALLAMLGYGLAMVAAGHFAERSGSSPKRVTWMLIWTALAAVACGHLAHLALFEPSGLSSPVRLVQLGSGQSSHGAVMGALLVLGFYALRGRDDPRALFDSWISGAVFAIPFARLGNLANSENVGRPWDGPWAFVFPRYDCPELAFQAAGECPDALARHPWPLYDAIDGLALIALVVVLHARGLERRRPGMIFAAVWVSWMGARFLLGFLNEHMTSADGRGMFTVEQWASLGSLTLGLALLALVSCLRRGPRARSATG